MLFGVIIGARVEQFMKENKSVDPVDASIITLGQSVLKNGHTRRKEVFAF